MTAASGMFQEQLATLTQQLLSTARSQPQRQEQQLQTQAEQDLGSIHANEVQKLVTQREREIRVVQDRVQHLDERVAVWQQLAQAAEQERDTLQSELEDVKAKARLKILELKERVSQLKPLADRSVEAEAVAKAGVERRQAADKRIAQAQAQLTSMEDRMEAAEEVGGAPGLRCWAHVAVWHSWPRRRRWMLHACERRTSGCESMSRRVRQQQPPPHANSTRSRW